MELDRANNAGSESDLGQWKPNHVINLVLDWWYRLYIFFIFIAIIIIIVISVFSLLLW